MGKEDIWKKAVKKQKGDKSVKKWIQVLGKYHAHEMTAILKQNLADEEEFKKDYKTDLKAEMSFNEFSANYGLGKNDKTLEKFKIARKVK